MAEQIKKAKRPIKKTKTKNKTITENPLDKLSPAHKEFCYAYVENMGNGSAAYKKVYPKAKDTSARANAVKLLANVNIKQAIQHLYTQIWQKRTEDLEKSKTYTLIHSIGNSDISDVIDLENNTLEVKSLSEIPESARKAIQSIDFVEKSTPNGPDRNIKIKMYDKLSALKLRAQIQGMIEEKVENNIEIHVAPAERPAE